MDIIESRVLLSRTAECTLPYSLSVLPNSLARVILSVFYHDGCVGGTLIIFAEQIHTISFAIYSNRAACNRNSIRDRDSNIL